MSVAWPEQVEFSYGISDTWASRARSFIESLEPGQLLTADLLREVLGDPYKQNAPGQVFHSAAKDELLEVAGYRQSEREGRHGSIIRIWRRV